MSVLGHIGLKWAEGFGLLGLGFVGCISLKVFYREALKNLLQRAPPRQGAVPSSSYPGL